MNDDLISRQALLDKGEYDSNFRLVVPVETIIAAPSVDAVVLPCKVNDTVYVLGESVVSEIPVLQIIIDEDECFVCAIGDFRGGCYPFSAFGKTVFLTREEAEAALEGREDNATD